MSWEVKTDIRGQSEHGLFESNMKTVNYLPGDGKI